MDCTNAFSVSLAECPQYIKVYAGLNANTQYYFLLIDVHVIEFYDIVTTDNNGALTIDCHSALFPDGGFNRHSGAYILQIYDNLPYYKYPEDLLFCGIIYDSVIITFKEVSTSLSNTTQNIICTP